MASGTANLSKFRLVTFAFFCKFLALLLRPYIFAWYPTAAIALFFTSHISLDVAIRIRVIFPNANSVNAIMETFHLIAFRIWVLLLETRSTVIVCFIDAKTRGLIRFHSQVQVMFWEVTIHIINTNSFKKRCFLQLVSNEANRKLNKSNDKLE